MLIAALLSYLQNQGQQVEATRSVKAQDILQGDFRRAYSHTISSSPYMNNYNRYLL